MKTRQKAPTQLQNTRGGRGRGVAYGARPVGWRKPPLPPEVTDKIRDEMQAPLQPFAVKHARKVWDDWWKSAPSLAVDMKSDATETLHWWIICVFRRALYLMIVREAPMVMGSMGQPVPNPLEGTIAKLTRDIDRAADRFGMDTLSRFRLHFEAQGQGQQQEDREASDAEDEYRRMLRG